MKTIAIFSPFGPLKSGVAHYADALSKELAKYYKPVFYIEGEYEPTEIKGLGDIRQHSDYRAEEDRVLFQASNGPLHGFMYPHMFKKPGVMTLHDRTLYDMAMKYWDGKPRRDFWIDFFANEGVRGVARVLKKPPSGATDIPARILHNLYLDENSKRVRFPFMRRVCGSVRGFLAHSHVVRDAAVSFGARCPNEVVPLAVEKAPPAEDKAAARRALGLTSRGIADSSFVALAYGHIQPHKRIDAVLDAWRDHSKISPAARLVLLGPRSPDYDLDKALETRGIVDTTILDHSYPPMETVYRYIYAADVCVNLRYPVYGSSSYSLMHTLSAGRATVVTDEETFSEFPDDIVIKAPYGREAEFLLDVFKRAEERPEEIAAIGRAAREFVESRCLWEHAGPRYRDFIEKVYRSG